MRPLPLLLMTCCVSLFSPRIQASRAEQDADRLDTIERLFDLSDAPPPPPSPDHDALSEPQTWPVLRRRPAPASLSWARPSDLVQKASPRLRLLLPPPPPLLRPRRHLTARGTQHHHAQLMRVGCKLGTCQVQNLSHRLYQLIGQRGREDSSPINPRSPHSYG